MSLSWAHGDIAGVDLIHEGDDIRCNILDGAETLPRRFVNQRTSADGTVYTQGIDTDGKGARFGAEFPNIPIDKFNSMIANINSAVDAGDPFDVNLQDDVFNIALSCTVDGSKWVTVGKPLRTNDQFVADVIFRFIST